MNQINFSYVVTHVDTENALMTVAYSADGMQTVQSVLRLPFEQENVDLFIKACAPIYVWDSASQKPRAIEVGTAGSGTTHAPVIPTKKQIETAKRDSLLLQSDWTQLADVPLSQAQRDAWAAYRQALRDITAQSGFPESASWPTTPSST